MPARPGAAAGWLRAAGEAIPMGKGGICGEAGEGLVVVGSLQRGWETGKGWNSR